MSKLDEKGEILYKQLEIFFKEEENVQEMVNVVKFSNPVSLRIIDYFLTNYSKRHTKEIYKEFNFDIYNNYKSNLKAFNKKYFDPFCRDSNVKEGGTKFKFYYNDHKEFIVTTIAQLNFFKWGIMYKIFDYIFEKNESIKEDIKLLKLRKIEQKKQKAYFHEEQVSLKDRKINYSVSF